MGSTSPLLENIFPPFSQYEGKHSFFEGKAPLSEGVGYAIVLGFGLFFSLITTLIVYLNHYFGTQGAVTSEHFNTAGRMIKTGLIANVIVSQWTWAATVLQSSNVAWHYGVSGPFWYASGATIQVLLFGVLAIKIKRVAPNSHTVAEIVRARWGKAAHITILFFCFSTNIIVTSMLLLGGAATTEALTGMDYRLAAFLIPWGVIFYTASGGLQATFISTYLHTVTIYIVLVIMIYVVYIKVYSSDQIYQLLSDVIGFDKEQCAEKFMHFANHTAGTYACGKISGNHHGSYLTMLSGKGLMFGIINIIGNFGTVFVDQSYWQSAIAARPEAAARGYLLGGICWFAIPFSLATSLGLACVALLLPVTDSEAGAGLVPPAVATHLLGTAGAVLILVLIFMAITSTGSAESIAVASLVSYDIYREYINPEATGDQILNISRIVVVVFGLVMGALAILLNYIGLNLGWVYLFMGVWIGSAVVPLWNLMTWKKASGTGAVIAAWTGLVLAVIGWLVAAKIQSGSISVANLGTNEVMLSGNLIAILSSGIIHWFWSVFIDPQDFDFNTLNDRIKLVEADTRGLTEAERDTVLLENTEVWIKNRGYLLTFILIFAWPILSIPFGVFTSGYFAFWVLISIAWGFGAAILMTFMPLLESSDDIGKVFTGLFAVMSGRKPEEPEFEVPTEKKLDESEDETTGMVDKTEEVEVGVP